MQATRTKVFPLVPNLYLRRGQTLGICSEHASRKHAQGGIWKRLASAFRLLNQQVHSTKLEAKEEGRDFLLFSQQELLGGLARTCLVRDLRGYLFGLRAGHFTSLPKKYLLHVAPQACA